MRLLLGYTVCSMAVLLSIVLRLCHRQMTALAFVLIPAWIIELYLDDGANSTHLAYWGVANEFLAVYLVITDLKEKRDQSALLKYNPFFDNNKIPRRLRVALLILAVISSLILLIERILK